MCLNISIQSYAEVSQLGLLSWLTRGQRDWQSKGSSEHDGPRCSFDWDLIRPEDTGHTSHWWSQWQAASCRVGRERRGRKLACCSLYTHTLSYTTLSHTHTLTYTHSHIYHTYQVPLFTESPNPGVSTTVSLSFTPFSSMSTVVASILTVCLMRSRGMCMWMCVCVWGGGEG